MKVGLVCPYSLSVPGGVQNHVLGLAGWLRAHGHEPAILAPGRVDAATLARRGLEPRHVTGLGAALAIRWNGSVARVAGGPLVAARVQRWLSEQQPEVVHLHEPVTPSAALWALLLARTPIIATFHLGTERSRVLALAGRLLHSRLRRIDRVLAVSETAAGVVRSHLGLDPVIVPNGIDLADFPLLEPPQAAAPIDGGAPNAPSQRPRITFLGRVAEPRKGLGVLLSALPQVEASCGPVEVVVAGPGDIEIPPSVCRIAALDDVARAELLKSTDVFVAPHRGGESFGLVLIEALAAGAPVVASDLPAFRDVLTDPTGHLVGQLFSVGDSAALARGIAQTLRRSRDRDLLRTQAARYDWSRVGPAVLAAYGEAVAARSAG